METSTIAWLSPGLWIPIGAMAAKALLIAWVRIRRREATRRELRARHFPAEFFAVATEAFFEKPRHLKRKKPELYEQLAGYYRVDPAKWRDPE